MAPASKGLSHPSFRTATGVRTLKMACALFATSAPAIRAKPLDFLCPLRPSHRKRVHTLLLWTGHLPHQHAPHARGRRGMTKSPKKPRVVAVIQARMGSTRLPGKVLKPIAGRPLLWHIVHRLKASQFIEQVAIATSVNPRDDAIVEFGRENDVAVVRGPEDDVLGRFARAAE